jgi:hypothetical protein
MKVQNESVGVPNGAAGAWATILTWRCMLNYLSKDYRRDGRDKSTLNWSISAESFRAPDARVLESDVKAYDRSLSCRGGCGLDDKSVSKCIDGLDDGMETWVAFFVEAFVSLHHAWQSGDYATAIKSAERISYLMRLYDTADLFISAIKGAVKAKGLPIDTSIHEPAVQLTDEQYRNIQSILGK